MNSSSPVNLGKITCRAGCGACCIAPSISSTIPGMPDGKAAGVRCVQLTDENRCMLFNSPVRPLVCDSYQATREFCGYTKEEAMGRLAILETSTAAGNSS